MNILKKRISCIYRIKKSQWIQHLHHIIIIVCFLTPTVSIAHPHSWVDLKTEIVGNNTQINGFKMSWTFDAMTSAYMLDGEDLSVDNKAKTLQKLANSIMKNINLEHYFTYLYDDETPVKYSFSNQGELTQNRTKLTLDFYLPLSETKDIKGHTLKLLIFEPSYYVDMSWVKKSDISFSADFSKQCALQLVEPKPTTQQISYAMSLPADADPDNELGQLFTQAVFITCSTEQE